MIYLQFVGGFIFCAIGAFTSYHSGIKTSQFYFPLGIGMALVSNFIWFSIAKQDHDSSSLMIKGLTWDAILVSTYLLVPVLFFGARFTTMQIIGIVLTVVGLFITKIP